MKVPARLLSSGIRQQRSSRRWLLHAGLLSLIAFGLQGTISKAQNAVVLVGAGSTVPAPLYNRGRQENTKRTPKIQMRTLPAGTTKETKQTYMARGDFGPGELPLTEKEREEGVLI